VENGKGGGAGEFWCPRTLSHSLGKTKTEMFSKGAYVPAVRPGVLSAAADADANEPSAGEVRRGAHASMHVMMTRSLRGGAKRKPAGEGWVTWQARWRDVW